MQSHPAFAARTEPVPVRLFQGFVSRTTPATPPRLFVYSEMKIRFHCVILQRRAAGDIHPVQEARHNADFFLLNLDFRALFSDNCPGSFAGVEFYIFFYDLLIRDIFRVGPGFLKPDSVIDAAAYTLTFNGCGIITTSITTSLPQRAHPCYVNTEHRCHF